MEYQNVTLSLPRDLVKRAKHIAVERGTSLSGLLAQMLEDLTCREDRYLKAKERNLAHWTSLTWGPKAASAGRGATCMSGEGAGLQFVDTNVLVYAQERPTGEKYTRTKALVKELWQSGTGIYDSATHTLESSI